MLRLFQLSVVGSLATFMGHFPPQQLGILRVGTPQVGSNQIVAKKGVPCESFRF